MKKLLSIIAILAMLLVLIGLLLCWVFRPKLSTLSDWELKIFLSLNGLEEWGTNDISAVREYIVKIEENPNYLPLINAFILQLKLLSGRV